MKGPVAPPSCTLLIPPPGAPWSPAIACSCPCVGAFVCSPCACAASAAAAALALATASVEYDGDDGEAREPLDRLWKVSGVYCSCGPLNTFPLF